MKINKKGQLATGVVTGIIGLVFLLVVSFVMIAQLTGSGLLTANSAEDLAVDNLAGNLSTGVGNISSKIPTFFTIIAAVVLIGFVLLLWSLYKRSGLGGGSSGGVGL